ncbi:MAG: DUF1259 domain-containing protein [Elusimicrobia bacterium]|nr:DUF1259 domain-containing protein [Elusimicrobiota bacterium]
MRKTLRAAVAALGGLTLLAPVWAEPKLDTARIEQWTGLKGTWNEAEDVFKVTFPRTDLDIKAAGVKLSPAQGLMAWVAFTPMGNRVAVMGDLVLAEDQVNPVMSAALDYGLEVTALNNHFLWEAPRGMFMHIGGMGDAEAMAAAVGKVFEKLKETTGGKGALPDTPEAAGTPLDGKALDAVFGATGETIDGVYKIVIEKTTRMGGHSLGKAMGVNTWAAFTGTDAKALVDGDVAAYESELQGVLKNLRKAGLYVTAIHNRLTGETPRVIFVHYWGVGPAGDLAKGIQTALSDQGKSKETKKRRPLNPAIQKWYPKTRID